MNFSSSLRMAAALTLSFLSGTASASTTLPTFSAPGVVAPSYPAFVDDNSNITVKRVNAGKVNGVTQYFWQLSGKGESSVFALPNSDYRIKNESFKYTANFDSNGDLITSYGNKHNLKNNLTINGKLGAGSVGDYSWKAFTSNKLLLSANLTALGTDSNALGFATSFTGGWAADQNKPFTGGSTGESLWLSSSSSTSFTNLVAAIQNGTLDNLLGNKNSMTFKHVSSVASVPVPAAVWLFGTGLTALLASRRKNQQLKAA